MGEVYRARDTRLDRLVAIKVASEHFSARFEREARSVAALNHPNICALYDVGPNYLVMELVEGTTLASVCDRRLNTSLGSRWRWTAGLKTFAPNTWLSGEVRSRVPSAPPFGVHCAAETFCCRGMDARPSS